MAPLRPLLRRLATLALAALPLGAGALDRFEIQVYTAEINDPGQLGLEVHLNFTPRGLSTPEYPGAIPPDRVGRMTLEPAIGVTEWLELGAYLQLAAAPGGDYRYGGNKLRAKLVLPERIQHELGLPVFLGLNAEVGRIPSAFEQWGWANEFRPIIGWRNDTFLVSVNPIFGYALTGPEKFKPEFEPAAKLAWDTGRRVALGVEYYAGLGPMFEGFLPAREQEHLVLGVLDLVPPREAEGAEKAAAAAGEWELNVGVGAGLTRSTGQHLVVKAIVGRSF
ncbi:MAG TPA: hypothetical protein VFP50_17165 [Anaeromyxobacteraceae bacterium]|nr:hypothetical protein [Anaeromyxobacteraceae bacterium]